MKSASRQLPAFRVQSHSMSIGSGVGEGVSIDDGGVADPSNVVGVSASIDTMLATRVVTGVGILMIYVDIRNRVCGGAGGGDKNTGVWGEGC